MDFDWPMREVWDGYLMPDRLCFPKCPDCGGSGYGPEARAVANTFYPHMIGGPYADALAWCDKIGQAEVDHLVEKGRLKVWRDGAWHKDARTADDVNAEQHQGGFRSHDCVNRSLLVTFRCERLGIETECPRCAGHGDIATAAEREEAGAWVGTGPPEGEGFQLWETTSEGSPVSPVFDSLDALCAYAAEHCTTFASEQVSAEDWRRMLDEGFVRHEEGNAVFI